MVQSKVIILGYPCVPELNKFGVGIGEYGSEFFMGHSTHKSLLDLRKIKKQLVPGPDQCLSDCQEDRSHQFLLDFSQRWDRLV